MKVYYVSSYVGLSGFEIIEKEASRKTSKTLFFKNKFGVEYKESVITTHGQYYETREKAEKAVLDKAESAIKNCRKKIKEAEDAIRKLTNQ